MAQDAVDEIQGPQVPVVVDAPDPMGDPMDRQFPDQGEEKLRPYVYGYYDLTPSQRFGGILVSYLVVLAAIDQRDLSSITDQDLAFLAWGANDQDALDAGRDMMYEEGLGDLYNEIVGVGVSEFSGAPKLNGLNESDVPGGAFGNFISDALYAIETETSYQSENWKDQMLLTGIRGQGSTVEKRMYDKGRVDTTYFFQQALNGGNLSQKAQKREQYGMNAVELGANTMLASMTFGAAFGAVETGGIGLKTGFKGLKAMIKAVMGKSQGVNNLVRGIQTSQAIWQSGRGTYRAIKWTFLGGGSGIGLILGAIIGAVDDNIDTEWDLLERSVKNGSLTVEEAAIRATYLSVMTGEEIPEEITNLEGYVALDRTRPKQDAEEKAQAEGKTLYEMLRPDDTRPPSPVSGDALSEDALILAQGFGVSELDVFSQIALGDAAEVADPTSGSFLSDSFGDGAKTEEEKFADEFRGSGSTEEPVDDEDTTTTTTTPSRSSGIITLDDIDPGSTLDDLDLTDEQLREIGAEKVRKANKKRAEVYAAQRQNEATRRGGVVGGLSPDIGITPTITPAPENTYSGYDTGMYGGGYGAGDRVEEFADNAYNEAAGLYVPRYYDEDVERIMGGWSIQQIQYFQDQAIEAGLIDPESRYESGSRDQATRNAFTSVVADANANGNTWEDQLQGSIDSYQKWLTDNPDKGKEIQPYTAFVAPAYLAPDYATLAQTTKQYVSQKLGRRPSKAEMALLTDQLAGFDKDQWESQVQADRQTYAGRARAYEDQQRGGGGEQSGGTTQGVDSAARFQQAFDEKFSGEVRHRERVDQAQGKNPGFFGSISNVERNL